jgi:VCBS repeat-containing protein
MAEYELPVVHILPATIAEGGTYNFTIKTNSSGGQTGVFYYTDSDSPDENEIFTVETSTGGIVLVNGVEKSTFTGVELKAGLVSFQHNGEEGTAAGFTFTLRDEANTVDGSFVFKVTPVNDAPVLQLDSQSNPDALPMISESGDPYTFGSADIYTVDPDQVDFSKLTYTVSSLTHGYILVGGVKKTTFTQANLDAGIVQFQQNGDEEDTASFKIVVKDSGNATSGTAQTFTFDVLPFDDPAVISGNITGIARALVKPTVSGKVIVTDPDTSAALVAVAGASSDYGTFSITSAGAWTYTIDSDSSVVRNLATGETVDDQIKTVTESGDLVSIKVTIQGTTNISGTDEDDTGAGALQGTKSNDYMFGLGGNDVVYGLLGNDSLYGGAGDDILVGGKGLDYLSGAGGSDTASYIDATAGVTASLLKSTLNTNDAKGDVYDSIENLTGTVFADKLTGDDAANVLSGGDGADILEGGSGADRLDGGTGIDTASYAGSKLGVTASLAKPGINTNDAKGDTYVSIENLTGSAFADTLTGNAAANVLSGGIGNDILVGGAGADKLDGGAGLDTASYAGASKGVTVSLLKPTLNTNDAKGDTYAGIENLTGSSYADKLTGNTLANVLAGGAGKDLLWGGTGADTFFFGNGDSTVAAKGRDVIQDFSHSQRDHIDLSLIDAISSTGKDDAFKIYATEKLALAHVGSIFLDVHGTTTTVYINNDADKSFDMAIDVLNNKSLVAGDFLL